MKKYTSNWFKKVSVLNFINVSRRLIPTVCVLFLALSVLAQTPVTVTGRIINEKNEPIVGASINQEGTNVYTTSDNKGAFQIDVKDTKANLQVTSIGYETKSVPIADTWVNIVVKLSQSTQTMEDVVIVGYGKQKKESVVGAISQVTGKELERAGGVNNLGMALTGNLPGLVTSSSSGMPGEESPQIVIRGQTSWNSSVPLVLIDGIEREMNAVDISSVESISILKDASATAVFGVKGANGVILITTKQGTAGKPNVRIRSNMTVKTPSKLPQKYDSYDAFLLRNDAIRHQLPYADLWGGYRPIELIEKYRNPLTAEERDKYPNVNWADALLKKSAMAYNTSASVSGGTNFVTYFAGVDFVTEGDLFKIVSNNRGYQPVFGYNRINARSNLDFNITKTTKFTTRLFGSNAATKQPRAYLGNSAESMRPWRSIYRTAPDAMQPIYSNGIWGFYSPANYDVPNTVADMATSGTRKNTVNQLTTDFVLQQDLKMLTEGLNLRVSYSVDNTFKEVNRGVEDGAGAQRIWYNPDTEGFEPIIQTIVQNWDLPINKVTWSLDAGDVDPAASYRRMNYAAQLNYARRFGKHDVTGTGVFMRERHVLGSNWNTFREDWVFRATYGYDNRYMFDANGAYNGSEKFGPGYRFDFFPSVALGWNISNEKFMKSIGFINNLKLRASWGLTGDDRAGERWLYQSIVNYGGNALMGTPPANTPYSFFSYGRFGNPDISWENSQKRNVGLEYSVWNKKISGSVDFFSDDRTDIINSTPLVPSYFGASLPPLNLGRVKSNGYEIELKFNHSFANGIRTWANTNYTHAVNKTIVRNDPELTPWYLKLAGYAIGQVRSYLDYGQLASWDDIYGSTARTSPSTQNKLAGDYNIIDFNADGIIDDNDVVPYGYTGTPQNTYNATIGAEWKGVSFFVQFYGVNNVTRYVEFPAFIKSANLVFVEGSYWDKNTGQGVPMPYWGGLTYATGWNGTRYQYDGSYIRLKNAEIGYTFSGGFVNRMGMKSCKLFLNGNNLLLWTKMPDDRESNFATGGGSSDGAYPTMKRFNLGIDINF
ncbi:SusC/RagA family TonB-linked outer membrane protein [Niabella aquatica]